MSGHSEGLWSVSQAPAIKTRWIDIVCGYSTAVAHVPVRRFVEDHSTANARRIVTCVNACDGISNAALEAGVIGKLVEALETVEVLCTNHSGRAENMTTFEFMCLIHGLVQPVVIAAKGEVA